MADLFRFTNFAVSALAEAAGPLDTVLYLAPEDVFRFPVIASGEKFPLVLANSDGSAEICHAVASVEISGRVEVLRGQEETTARGWLAGTVAQHCFTAGTIFAFGSLTPRGGWNIATAYSVRDLITYQGLAYVAASASTGDLPSANSTIWQQLFSPGGGEVTTLAWNGTWDQDVAYVEGALVRWEGMLWRAGAANEGETPNRNSESWEAFAPSGYIGRKDEVLVALGTNSYATDTVPSLALLYEGLTLKVEFQNTNTGPATLKIGTADPISIRKASGQALVAGDAVIGEVYELTYRASTQQFVCTKGLGVSNALAQLVARATALETTLGTELPLLDGRLDDYEAWANPAGTGAKAVLAALAGRMDNLEASVQTLQNQVTSLGGTVAGHTTRLNSQDDTLTGYGGRLGAIEGNYVRDVRMAPQTAQSIPLNGNNNFHPQVATGFATNSYGGIGQVYLDTVQQNKGGSWNSVGSA